MEIVTPHAVPAEFEKLTQDVVLRALGSLGISGIDKYLREGKPTAQFFPHPVRQDGPGWRAEVDLPYGVTATQVIERREQLASGLRRPLGAVWPEPVTTEHAGRLELWVGRGHLQAQAGAVAAAAGRDGRRVQAAAVRHRPARPPVDGAADRAQLADRLHARPRQDRPSGAGRLRSRWTRWREQWSTS